MDTPSPALPPFDDWRLVNCAECRTACVGESMRPVFAAAGEEPPGVMPFVAGRIMGRPYCPACLALRPPVVDGTRAAKDVVLQVDGAPDRNITES